MADSKFKYLGFAVLLGLIGLAVLVFINQAAPRLSQSGEKTKAKAMRPSPISNLTVMLNPSKSSEDEGSVELKNAEGGKTSIEVVMTRLSNSATTSAQPVYIRDGNCKEPGKIVMTLERLKNGVSKTIVTETIQELLAKGDLIITVHKSATDTFAVTSCTELKTS